jgi:hypothetical protein
MSIGLQNTSSAALGGGVTDGDKGDVVVSGSGAVWTIDANAVANSKLAVMPAYSIKANLTNGSAVPTDVADGDLNNVLPDTADRVIGFDDATGELVSFPASKLLNVMFSGVASIAAYAFQNSSNITSLVFLIV